MGREKRKVLIGVCEIEGMGVSSVDHLRCSVVFGLFYQLCDPIWKITN